MKLWRRPLTSLIVLASAFAAGYVGYSFSQDRAFAQDQAQRAEVRRGLEQVGDLSSVFRHVGQVVEPSVVNIEVRKKSPQQMRFHGEDPRDMLRRFFGRDLPGMDEQFEMPEPQDMPEEVGNGSGVIIEAVDGKGYIVTNNHVAGGAQELTITLNDGRTIRDAKVLGTDPKSDLAVIEVQADRLVAAQWGNSDQLAKGDWVLAFGSPFNFVGSMTHGIVSALNRQAGILGSGGYENFIQVDAPINPGNSGGPLVNIRGEVVGINTAIATRSGGFMGIGFAIPSNQAKFIYTALKEKGKVTRGWLGVGISDVSENRRLARSFGYEQNTGVLVNQVIAGTPATDKLENGDIITGLNGKPIDSSQELRNRIAAIPPDTQITLNVFRNGKTQDVQITLGEQPDDVLAARTGRPQQNGEQPASLEKLGVSVQTLTAELAERQNLTVSAGALITRVDRNSPASREGLRPGDVVTQVSGQKITSADDFAAAIRNADLTQGVRLYVVSQQGSRFVFLSTEN